MTRQRGMTITELMVATLVAMLLLGGMMQIFLSSKQTYTVQEGLSRLQENGRFAMDILQRETRMAANLGCVARAQVFNNLNNASALAYDFESGLRGFEANGTGTGASYTITATNPTPATGGTNWTPNLPAPLASNTVIPGTDVLVVRYVGTDTMPLMATNDGLELIVHDEHDFEQGELLAVTDCTKASIFQATTIGADFLVHAQGGGFNPGNALSPWGGNQTYTIGSEIGRVHFYAFYIGQGADGSPSLFQQRLNRAGNAVTPFAEELIDGVESMQILYGVDTNGDQQLDQYVTANAVSDWDSVLSVRIALLLRTPENIQPELNENNYTVNGTLIRPVADQRQRRVFSTTITLRNRTP